MIKEQDNIAISTLRTLAIDAVEKAQSGHMGMPLGAAPMAFTLWSKHLSITPTNPHWFNRDRFILSAGHGSMLLYGLLHLSGFNLTKRDLEEFRKFESKTPGHPEWSHTEGVDVTTGPLGQGLAMSVGLALAEKKLAKLLNKGEYQIVNHYTYVICGDGDLMEGVSHEAISLAGHLKLNKLIVLYDSNASSLDAQLDQSFSDNIKKKFEAINWEHISVPDGNDLQAIDQAITQAKKSDKPSVIEVNTEIGFSLPDIAGTHRAHSDPVGEENVIKAKETLKWLHPDPFTVPQEAFDAFEDMKNRGEKAEREWQEKTVKYKEEYPEEGEILNKFLQQDIGKEWEEVLPKFKINEGPQATRSASHEVLNTIAPSIPQLIGGAADLSSSTKVTLDESTPITADDFSGRNIYFGVREFGMAAVANGLALHQFIPFVSTYFVFSDYMKPAIRLSALMGLPVIYIFTHDSIAVGKDGPTHQPIEQLASFRSMPNLQVIRPADSNETAEAWRVALRQTNKPTVLVLGRQSAPILSNTASLSREGVERGGYVLSKSDNPQGILIATGSEVALALEAKEQLLKENIEVNVVSLPSWDLFEKQPKEYKANVLPAHLKRRITIEMGSKLGWREYAGDEGIIMSVDEFGVSGEPKDVINSFGFNVENIVKRFKSILH